jgi:hypothetical protein
MIPCSQKHFGIITTIARDESAIDVQAPASELVKEAATFFSRTEGLKPRVCGLLVEALRLARRRELRTDCADDLVADWRAWCQAVHSLTT